MRRYIDTILSTDRKKRIRIVVQLYGLVILGIVLYINPFHYNFITDQIIVVLLWVSTILLFKLSFQWSFILGLLFITFSALATLFNHPGYAERFGPFTFWMFAIGLLQRILEAFQSYKPQIEPKKIKKTTLAIYYVPLNVKVLLLAAITIPLVVIFQSWLRSAPLTSGDWVYKYSQELMFDIPRAWRTDGLGIFTIPFLWVYPLQFIERLVFFLFHFDFGVIEKFVWFIPILALSIISNVLFIKTFGGKFVAMVFGLLFFFLNTYTILLFAGGQTLFALGYAMYPLVFVVIHKTTENNRLSYKLLSGLLVAILGFADPRIALLFLLTITLYLVYRFLSDDLSNLRNLLNKYISIGLFIFLIPLLLHAYWILPTFIANTRLHIEPLPSPDAALHLSFMTLANVFTVFQPHWPENIFGKTHQIPFLFFVFPFIFYAAPFLIKKPVVWFFIVLSLVSAFLTKGMNDPFGNVYPYLTRVLPGFALFRDPSKFYVPLILSYTLMFGLVVEHLYLLLSKFSQKKRPMIRILPILFLASVTLFLYVLAYPAFVKQMQGTFVGHQKPMEYGELYKKLTNDENYYRTLWLPQKTYFSPNLMNHPVVNSLELAQLEPFNVLIKNDYHPSTYLEDPASVDILRMLSIRFVQIVHPRELRFNNEKDLEGAEKATLQLVNDLSNRSELSINPVVNNTTTFEVLNPLPHFYAANRVFWLYGSGEAYATIRSLPNVSLVGNAFIRKETISDIPITPIKLWQAQIIESNFIPESGVLTFALPRFERHLYIFNTEINPAIKSVDLRAEGLEENQMRIYVRRVIDLTTDKEQVYGRNIKTLWQQTVLNKIPGGENNYSLSLPDAGEFARAPVDRIIAYPSNKIDSLQSFFTSDEPLPAVETITLSPTDYIVSVREATNPYMLIFSEAFSNGWRASISDKLYTSFPIFNVINGYIMDTQGNYTVSVTFTSQRMVGPFAWFSLLIFLLILFYLVFAFVKEHKTKQISA